VLSQGTAARRLEADARALHTSLLQFGGDSRYSRSISGVTDGRVSFRAASKKRLRAIQILARRLEAGAAHQVFQVRSGIAFGAAG
jgi:hypothetical protein